MRAPQSNGATPMGRRRQLSEKGSVEIRCALALDAVGLSARGAEVRLRFVAGDDLALG
jgi:hypothetical protein